jgi:hypothetical protein
MTLKLYTIVFSVFLGLFFSIPCQAGKVHKDFPDTIDPGGSYVFYSHGYIVEGDNPSPVHPEFGVYDFPSIKLELASSNFDLIAYHRPQNTDPAQYAKALAAQVKQLLDAGVPPGKITILGFSKGGYITALASDELKNEGINVIILAGCWGWVEKMPQVHLFGNFLSIYETSDSVGSCKTLADRSSDLQSFEEIAISTGKKHGAFYIPLEVWVVPVRKWIESQGGL